MNNETKLTAADLAMYLGCEAQVNSFGDEKFVATMTGADVAHERATILVNGANYGPSTYPVLQIKPILRPLSDMTEEEANNEVWDTVPEYTDFSGLVAHVSPAWRYLLSRHFDLFGWIDAGLAIDKTKTTQP